MSGFVCLWLWHSRSCESPNFKLFKEEVLIARNDRWDWIGWHQVVTKAKARGLDGRNLTRSLWHRIIATASKVHPTQTIPVATLVCRSDHRCDLIEMRAFNDKICRTEPDVCDFWSARNLSLLIVLRARSCIETQILRQVEQEARLITLLWIVGLPLMTSITANNVGVLARVFVFGASTSLRHDFHEDNILAVVLVWLPICSHLHLLVVLFLLLNQVFEFVLFVVILWGETVLLRWSHVSVLTENQVVR